MMAKAARDRLAGIPGVEMLTPPDRMATLVTFRIAAWDAATALDELAGRTEDEIERVASAVELIASHTPATLPQRPRLTVLGQGSVR